MTGIIQIFSQKTATVRRYKVIHKLPFPLEVVLQVYKAIGDRPRWDENTKYGRSIRFFDPYASDFT